MLGTDPPLAFKSPRNVNIARIAPPFVNNPKRSIPRPYSIIDRYVSCACHWLESSVIAQASHGVIKGTAPFLLSIRPMKKLIATRAIPASFRMVLYFMLHSLINMQQATLPYWTALNGGFFRTTKISTT